MHLYKAISPIGILYVKASTAIEAVDKFKKYAEERKWAKELIINTSISMEAINYILIV